MKNKNKYKPLLKNIPEPKFERVIIVGAGFGGLKLARKLLKSPYQVVLIDKNNYHQFQPLYYQVATAGLEPSAISFPIRKLFQNYNNFHFRITNLEEIVPEDKMVKTSEGYLDYDHLVIATGVDTNYYGLENIRKNALPMKSVSEALFIRNTVLQNYEAALNETDEKKIESLLNMVIVGGGPTGVELAGALAEMKKYILPKDYPELDFSRMRIFLFEGSDRLLPGMSKNSSQNAYNYLKKLGVVIYLSSFVKDYDGEKIMTGDGSVFNSNSVIWAAGVSGHRIKGLDNSVYGSAGRFKTSQYHNVGYYDSIYAIGDISFMETEKYPEGHPQVAQTAIQQALNLGNNLIRMAKGKQLKAFEYKDKGSLATVGRHLAVADLPFMKARGYLAWVLWSFVHLFSIVGVRNRILVFINWIINYFTYDQSLRLLIRHKN